MKQQYPSWNSKTGRQRKSYTKIDFPRLFLSMLVYKQKKKKVFPSFSKIKVIHDLFKTLRVYRGDKKRLGHTSIIIWARVKPFFFKV